MGAVIRFRSCAYFSCDSLADKHQFNMQTYASRFGVCDAAGVCALPTIRQSTITGILSVGAFLGALGSGSVADKIGLRVTCLTFIFIFMIGIAIEVSHPSATRLQKLTKTDISRVSVRSNLRRSSPHRSRYRCHFRSRSRFPSRGCPSCPSRFDHRFIPALRHPR